MNSMKLLMWIAVGLLAVVVGGLALAVQSTSEDDIKTIEVLLGDFYFKGPEGRSGPTGKDGEFNEPTTVLRLKNDEPVRLVFRNISTIVTHQVVTPLLAVHRLGPGESVEINLTPSFLDAEDGETLVFNLTCHERHGLATGHYTLGMQARIEVVP